MSAVLSRIETQLAASVEIAKLKASNAAHKRAYLEQVVKLREQHAEICRLEEIILDLGGSVT